MAVKKDEYSCAKRYLKMMKCKHRWCNFEGCLICGASPKEMEKLGYNLRLTQAPKL